MKVVLRSFTVTPASTGAAIKTSGNSGASTSTLTNSVKIKALSTNTGSVLIGGPNSQDYELTKGQEVSLCEIFEKDGGSADVNLAEIFAKAATSGDKICVIYADRTNPFKNQ